MKSFKCRNCKKIVNIVALGTHHRNHCPFCLWSLHVDDKTSDRYDTCQGMMEPIGLTFKKIKPDKYDREKKGELMIIHCCLNCGKISLNRLAGDDNPQKVLQILDGHFHFNTLQHMKLEVIELLTEKDRKEVERQLFGKTEAPQGNLLKDN